MSSPSSPGYSKYDPAQDQKGVAEEPPRRRFYEICLVFPYKTSKGVKFDEEQEGGDALQSSALAAPTEKEKSKMQTWKQRREAIIKSLQNCGLLVYSYYTRDRDEVVVKVGASAQKLRNTAARMKYKLQLKKQYLSAYAEYRHDFPGRPERQFKDRRVISHIYQTHAEDDYPDSDSIFRTADKICLIHHIITSKDKDCAGINVGDMLHRGELRSYFPLHEAYVLEDLKSNKMQWFLMPEEFANRVRDYFGDRIAFYFLFMAFYWKWLAPLAVVGLALQLIDFLVRTPDNVTAIPFCVLMSVWCTFLPCFWRRQEAKYAIGWGTLDLVESLEPCRPEHHGEPRINPVTAQVEPYYPWQKRLRHYALSSTVMVIVGAVLVLLALLLCVTRHKLKDTTKGGILFFQFLTAVLVEIMNAALTVLARWLNKRENHRTQTEHETHLLIKVSLFKFICSYSTLYYIAFFKHHSYLFDTPMECLKGDCFLDLQAQLATFVFFRLTVMNFVEFLTPKLTAWWRSSAYGGQSPMDVLKTVLHGHTLLEMADMSAAEKQAKKDKYDEFANFDETLISHGYGTFFAVTSPWVCLATLGGTLLEIYVDMRSLMDLRQRTIPLRARNNEPWSTAFELYGILGAATNILLLIFASDQYDTWTFTEKLILFLYLEHMIILSRVALRIIFPEVPRNVELLQLKQEHMVHRCLENIKVEQNHDFSMFREQASARLEVFEHDILEPEEEDQEVELKLEMGESARTLLQGISEESTRWFRRH